MIIVSQDKKSIYNFDNVKSIDRLRNEIYITDEILADEGASIAKYNTEERAKEVLEEIIDSLQNKSFVEIDSNGITSKIAGALYRMPQE